MSEQENQDKYESGEIMYQGNQVPKVLRYIYGAFITWAIVYFAYYGVSDLLEWLK